MIEGNDIISIDPDAYVIDALDFMKRNNIRRVVVSRGGEILGIFTVDEALYHIIYNDIECKLRDAKLKKPIFVDSNDLQSVLKTMIAYDSDSVIYHNKIITYKDVMKRIDWKKFNMPISTIVKNAITVEPYSRISTAGEIMLKNKIRHLPVYEKYLYGIISSRDIVYNYDIDLNLSVSKIMVLEVYYVKEDEEISSVAEILITRNIGSVVVLNGGVKIATLKDFLNLASRNLIN